MKQIALNLADDVLEVILQHLPALIRQLRETCVNWVQVLFQELEKRIWKYCGIRVDFTTTETAQA